MHQLLLYNRMLFSLSFVLFIVIRQQHSVSTKFSPVPDRGSHRRRAPSRRGAREAAPGASAKRGRPPAPGAAPRTHAPRGPRAPAAPCPAAGRLARIPWGAERRGTRASTREAPAAREARRGAPKRAGTRREARRAPAGRAKAPRGRTPAIGHSDVSLHRRKSPFRWSTRRCRGSPRRSDRAGRWARGSREGRTRGECTRERRRCSGKRCSPTTRCRCRRRTRPGRRRGAPPSPPLRRRSRSPRRLRRRRRRRRSDRPVLKRRVINNETPLRWRDARLNHLRDWVKLSAPIYTAM